MKKREISLAAQAARLYVEAVPHAEAETFFRQCDWGKEFCRRQPIVFLDGTAYCDRHATAVIGIVTNRPTSTV